MKIAYCSDLHLEIGGTIELLNTERADVLVLAGDIVPIYLLQRSPHRDKLISFFEKTANNFEHVVYVFGNHEYYGGDIDLAIETARATFCHIDNLYILDNQIVTIGGIDVIGSTMWTDFDGEDPVKMLAAGQMMNDFRAIEKSSRPVYFKRTNGDTATRSAKLTPTDTVEIHRASYNAVDELLTNSERPAIVVTHHAPSYLSSHPRYLNDPLNSSFCCDCSELILKHPHIKVWIHGHTHDDFNYTISDTNVVCNPRGYPREQTFSNFSLNYFEV